MTSEHIINSEMIENKKSVDILYENKKKKLTIELNKNERIIRTFLDKNIDATIIEILKKDKIKEDYFLSPCDGKDYDSDYKNLINKEIQITQFPKGENLSLSKGKILKIKGNRFSHDASTLSGSSGGPIVLFGKEKVIGIHKGGNEAKSKNYGDLIWPINDIINRNGIFDSDGKTKEQGTDKDDKIIYDSNEENSNYENNDSTKSDSENEIKEEEKEEVKRKKSEFDNNNDSNSSLESEDVENNNINLLDLIPKDMKIGFCDTFYGVFDNLGIKCTNCFHQTKYHKKLGNGRYLCNKCNGVCAIK